MTPLEKICREEGPNRSVMILRPEGMFYRAYERSAYLVCKTVREFKPTKRFYKIVGAEIVSIGFPKDTLSKYIGERRSDADPDGTLRVQSGTELDEALFDSWKKSQSLAEDVKLLLRILCDLRQISTGNYMAMSQMAVSISGQLRAWKTSAESSQS